MDTLLLSIVFNLIMHIVLERRFEHEILYRRSMQGRPTAGGVINSKRVYLRS